MSARSVSSASAVSVSNAISRTDPSIVERPELNLCSGSVQPNPRIWSLAERSFCHHAMRTDCRFFDTDETDRVTV
jgi:hypothetical protein